MNYAADNNEDFGTALAFLGLLPFFVVFMVWLVSAIVAGAIAEERNRSGFGFAAATFFFLGPLGVGVALLATRREHRMVKPKVPAKAAPRPAQAPTGKAGREKGV